MRLVIGPWAAAAIVASAAGAGAGAGHDLLGDPLPEGAVARLGSNRLRPGAMVRAVTFWPDANTLCTIGGQWGQQESIRFWDASTGRLIRSLPGYERGGFGAAFSRDGKLLALAGTDQVVRLLSSADGKELGQVRSADGGVGCTALSPDGMLLAIGNGQMVRLYEVPSGKKVRDLGPGAALAFSRDGKRLAAVHTHGAASKSTPALQVYEVATGKAAFPLGDLSKLRYYSLAASPVSDLLAAGGTSTQGGQCKVTLFDISTGKEVKTLTPSGGEGYAMMSSLSFSPDGKLLAGWHPQVGIIVWDIQTGKERWTFGAGPDGRMMANLYFSNQTSAIVFSPDSARLVAGTSDGVIRVWDVKTGRELSPGAGHAGAVACLAFAPDGATILTGGRDSSARLWEVATGRPLLELAGNKAPVEAVAFGEDGRLAASGGTDGRIRVWEFPSAQESFSLDRPNPAPVRCLRFTPDGRQLLAVTGTGEALVLDLRTRAEQLNGRRPLVPSGISSAAFSWDGGLLAIVEQAGLLIQEMPWRERMHTMPVGPGARGLAFCPWGDLVAWSTGDVTAFMEVDSGREVLRISGGKQWNTGGTLTFSPDGGALALAGDDGGIDLYSARDGEKLGRLSGHAVEVTCLAFAGRACAAASGRQLLASGSLDTTAMVWDVSRLLRQAGRSATTQTAPASAPAGPAGPEELWAALAESPEKAYAASWELLDRSPEAVRLLGARLKPIPSPPAETVKRLIAGLDGPRYSERVRAYEELSRLGNLAEPALRAALGTTQSEEIRARAEALLEGMRSFILTNSESLRQARGIRILEKIGTAEARAILEGLTQGAPAAQPTRLARTALDRMARRATPNG